MKHYFWRIFLIVGVIAILVAFVAWQKIRADRFVLNETVTEEVVEDLPSME